MYILLVAVNIVFPNVC